SNANGNSFGDACDPADTDLDGFSDRVEYSAGTRRATRCGTQAWPPDINNDTFSDISDVSALTGVFGFRVPDAAPARYDIAPDPPDHFVDITDITKLTGLFGSTCGPVTSNGYYHQLTPTRILDTRFGPPLPAPGPLV